MRVKALGPHEAVVMMQVGSGKQAPSIFCNEDSACMPRVALDVVEALSYLSSAPSPRVLFKERVRADVMPEDAVQSMESVMFGSFRVWPIFLDAGWRGVPGAIYNKRDMEREFPEYLSNDPAAKVPSGIAEAARNVDQHGRVMEQYPPLGGVCFAPGAIFLDELSLLDNRNQAHKFLIGMVSDQGSGLADPSLSLLPGVGSPWGENHNGMGYELGSCVLMIVRSREGRWLLFDGLHHDPSTLSRVKAPYRDIVGIPHIAELKLLPGTEGCQKIFIFQHPQGDGELLSTIVLKRLELLRS